MPNKITLITTVRHNPGDDFVREGIEHLLSKLSGKICFSYIHKHLPLTARPSFDWFHLKNVASTLDKLHPLLGLRVAKVIDQNLPISKGDRIACCDTLVQSGAPIYWTGSKGDCYQNEWWQPLIERRWIPHAKGRKFLNIAGGTCQHYFSDASEFAGRERVLEYIRRFHDMTALTTVRDKLSNEVLRLAGRTAPVLPCTSIYAVDRIGLKADQGDYVVLNYMPGGGHYDFGLEIDYISWKESFTRFIYTLAKSEKCLLVCHDKKELIAAQKYWPEFNIFYSTNYRDYLKVYSRAKYGILNRVHGAFAMASLGKPALVIGSDSRSRMMEMIGLESIFVNDASNEVLMAKTAALNARTKEYPEQIREIKRTAGIEYYDLLSGALS